MNSIPRTSLRLGVLSLAASLTIAAAACGTDASASAGADITIDSSGAYPVIRSAGGAAQWQAELVATITADTGVGEAFGSVRSVLLDRDGFVYVVDPSYRQISVFDSTGALSHRIGRRGKGPGEYTDPYSLAWLGDSLALLDPGIPRVMLVSKTGEWLAQWPYARIGGDNVVRLYRTTRGFWAIGHRARTDGSGERTFVRFSGGAPTDTIASHEADYPSDVSTTCRLPTGYLHYFRAPFAPTPWVIPDAEGRQYVSAASGYRIAVVGRAQDTLFVIERPVQGAPITDAEWEEGNRAFEDFKTKERDEHCDRTSFARSATKAIVQWMFLDSEGQLWVEVLSADGRSYDVFGPDGRLRATVTGLPTSGGNDPSVMNGRFAVVVADADDVQRVEVYRIRR